ncbi:MAG TPA: G1 family glutamic endopeptidase [Candidatus Dormibacteraeota bacterium]|nr:G1 family glutamic endopeptidase [Candidatus Dormibacteraeota bacterium]
MAGQARSGAAGAIPEGIEQAVGRLVLRNAAVAAITAVVVVFASSPALAAARGRSGPNHRVRYGVSTNWAGYAVSGFGPYTTVSASWTQPAVDCSKTPTGYSVFWVGLDGDTSKTVEQTGTEANCVGGSASYAGWYEMFPKRPVISSNRVEPGDSLTASVSAGVKGSFHLTLTDATQGWSLNTTQKKKSARRASAEVIAEAPATRKGVLPLADFAPASFASATINGSLLTETTPGVEPITMKQGETVKATPSGLSGGNFSVTWQHA